MQEIVLPWRDSGCLLRRQHFEALTEFYSENGFKVVIGDNKGDFSRSAARNAGVESIKSDVAVVIDADNLISPSQIKGAISFVKNNDQYMVKPFNRFGYLTEESTNIVYENGFDAVDSLDLEYINPTAKWFNGGAYVITKRNWNKVGGFDEAFIGWGAEDDAFHIMCKRKLRGVRYLSGMDYHLYHPAHRVTSKENYEYLMKRYVDGN
jgi:predicted glycosyltransferase involved in capsule biosynthesis